MQKKADNNCINVFSNKNTIKTNTFLREKNELLLKKNRLLTKMKHELLSIDYLLHHSKKKAITT